MNCIILLNYQLFSLFSPVRLECRAGFTGALDIRVLDMWGGSICVSDAVAPFHPAFDLRACRSGVWPTKSYRCELDPNFCPLSASFKPSTLTDPPLTGSWPVLLAPSSSLQRFLVRFPDSPHFPCHWTLYPPSFSFHQPLPTLLSEPSGSSGTNRVTAPLKMMMMAARAERLQGMKAKQYQVIPLLMSTLHFSLCFPLALDIPSSNPFLFNTITFSTTGLQFPAHTFQNAAKIIFHHIYTIPLYL